MHLIHPSKIDMPYSHISFYTVSDEFRYTILDAWNGFILGATNDESIVESIHGNGEDTYVYDSVKYTFIHCSKWVW